MGTDVNQKSSVLNQITTTMVQDLENNCSANCDASASGNTIIVAGRNPGGVTIKATCQSNAKCAMSNQVVATVENVLASAISQQNTSVTDFFNDGILSSKLTQTSDIKSILTNNMTQMTQNSCQSNSTSDATNNFVFISGSGNNGKGVLISADANVSASCTMTNLAKAQAQNQVSNNNNQKGKQIGMFAVIFVALLGCLLIGGLIIILLMATGVLSSAFHSGGSGKREEEKEGEGGEPGAHGGQGGQGGQLNQLENLLGGGKGGEGGVEGGEGLGAAEKAVEGGAEGGGGGGGLLNVVESNPEILLA